MRTVKYMLGVVAMFVVLAFVMSLIPKTQAQSGPTAVYAEQTLYEKGQLIGWVIRDPYTGERVFVNYQGGCATLLKR